LALANDAELGTGHVGHHGLVGQVGEDVANRGDYRFKGSGDHHHVRVLYGIFMIGSGYCDGIAPECGLQGAPVRV
jgi:hypothetical protein